MERLFAFVSTFTGPWPYVFVFAILLACGFGLPVPEDVTLFVGGLLSYYQKADVFLMIAIAMAGVLIGDGTIFILGHKYGRALTGRWIFKKVLHPERFEAIRVKFHKHGNKIIFFGRFMPGLRTPIFFSAGTLHIPARVFFFYDGMAALISVPTIIYSVFYFGDEVEHVISVIKNVENGIVLLVLVVVLFFVGKWYIARRKAASESASPPGNPPA